MSPFGTDLQIKHSVGSLVEVESRCRRAKSFQRLFMSFARDANGRRCQRNSVAPAQFTNIFKTGTGPASSWICGGQDSPSTMKWRASLGSGKASTGHWSKHRWRSNASARIQRIGEKNGRKRSLLVDARGVPLSLVASGANVHDVKLLAATLERVVTERPVPTPDNPHRLCADAGYKGGPALEEAESRNYEPHIKQRRDEVEAKRTQPGFKARRWVVERTHSWLNRYRKLLVSFEKTEEGYVALLTLAAAMICWRQTTVIYG